LGKYIAMKVVLVNPPRWREYTMIRGYRCEIPSGKTNTFPYWLGAVAGYLEKNKILVKVFDLAVEDKGLDHLRKALKREKPDIVYFIAANCSIDDDVKVAQVAKEANSDCITVIQESVYASAFPKVFLKENPSVDVVIRSDPEIPVLDLCKGKPMGKIKGIAYRGGKKIMENEPQPMVDLDSLGIPAYHLFPMELYDQIGVRFSRGCPFPCTFCSVGGDTAGRGFNKAIRYRSPESMVRELKILRDKYSLREFVFRDETFTLRPDRIHSLCKKIIKEKLGMEWSCQTRVDCVDKETFSLMKKAGCYSVDFGIESAEPKVIKSIKKHITMNDVRKAFSIARDSDLQRHAYLIFGFPGSDEEDMDKMIRVISEILPDSTQISLATPIPGTAFYDEAKKTCKLKISDHDLYRSWLGNYMIFDTKQLKAEEVYKIVRNAEWKIFRIYVGWRVFREAVSRGKTWKFLIRRAKDLARLLFHQLKVEEGEKVRIKKWD
jgi:radical SAM superfamily enzyme YgiQ (UPF0313 family)